MSTLVSDLKTTSLQCDTPNGWPRARPQSCWPPCLLASALWFEGGWAGKLVPAQQRWRRDRKLGKGRLRQRHPSRHRQHFFRSLPAADRSFRTGTGGHRSRKTRTFGEKPGKGLPAPCLYGAHATFCAKVMQDRMVKLEHWVGFTMCTWHVSITMDNKKQKKYINKTNHTPLAPGAFDSDLC